MLCLLDDLKARFNPHKLLEMAKENDREKTSELENTISAIEERTEQEKEEKIIDLIIKIIVSSTLKEYYETSNKIPPIQSNRPK